MALCGIRYVNLHEDTVKILTIHYSYSKQLENDENFKKYIAKIENPLKLLRERNLSLEGKITVFKSLTLHEITHLALVKIIPPPITDQLNQNSKEFYSERVTKTMNRTNIYWLRHHLITKRSNILSQ